MIKAGVVGATGYTGSETLRLLAGHPDVDVEVITSRTEQGKNVAEIFPALDGYLDLTYCDVQTDALVACDVVFFATPNAIAMDLVPDLLKAGTRVIDLSADFRLKDAKQWSQWYGQQHTASELLQQAVYGLPEINREAISSAQLVANPGCYPTAVILALMPALKNKTVDPSGLIADVKSGVSGAGRKAAQKTQFCEISESFSAYSVSGHRHLPEICQLLQQISGDLIEMTFTPHLVPMNRGIHATVYARLKKKNTDIQELYENYYKDEFFVNILPAGSHPDTRSVRGSNLCKIALHTPQQKDILVVLSVIDNLIKGAAGQAIQNMNIMFGLDEKTGLLNPPLFP